MGAGRDALHDAVRKRYKEVIKQLASYGIDLNVKDQDGPPALDYAQSSGFMPLAHGCWFAGSSPAGGATVQATVLKRVTQ